MPINADSVTVELIAKTDGYTAKVNQAAASTEAAMGRVSGSIGKAENVINLSAARIANGQRNLGRQFADVGASLSSGSSPFVVLAQQLPQIADALTDTGGKAAQFASVLTGPVGAAALAVGSILATTLLPKLLETGDSVDKLVAKLQENAAKARLSAEAQSIFTRTLEGGAQASAELNEQLGKQVQTEIQAAQAALRSASAQRAANIETRQRIVSQIALTRALLEQDVQRARQGGDRGDLAAGARERNAGRLVQLRKDEATATKAVADAQAAVVKASIPLLDNQAAAASDKSAAATRRHTLALGGLRDAYIKASAAATTNAERERAARQYREGRARIDTTLASDQDAIRESNKKGPKGPSAETLAKRAEAARVREVRDNEAYQRDLESINGQIIAAQRERAVTAEDAARFEREAIQVEFQKRKDAIAADLDAKKYTAAQAAELNERNEYAKALKLRNVAVNEDLRTLQDLAKQDAGTIGILQDQAQAQLAIAETQGERKRLELEIINLKYQEKREQLDYLRAQAQLRGDLTAQNAAQDQIDALPGLQAAEKVGVEQRNRSRYEQYRRNLSSADSLKDDIDGVKIDTLEKITDELTNATKAALGLKGAFGDIVGELIKIGIQRRLIGPLADGLFGKADGSSAGGLGGFLKSFTSFASGGSKSGGASGLVDSNPDRNASQALSDLLKGSIFGRASGGNVVAGKIYKINESGPELFQPAQSGKIYPTGSLAAKAGGNRGNTTVVSAPQFNLRGAVITAELYRDMESISRRNAAQAGKLAVEAAPGRVNKYQTLGT